VARLLPLALLLAQTACSDDDDANAPVDLWPIPNVGSGSYRPPRGYAGSSSAGDFAPPPRAGRGGSGGSGSGGSGDSVASDEDAGPAMEPDPTLALLDPEEVYIFGTLSEGACYLDAIAPVLAPDRALVGFDCGARASHTYVRPTDGRLIYSIAGEGSVHAFECDGCVHATAGMAYPSDPTANDEPVMTACDRAAAFLMTFQVAADGETVARCHDDRWYRADGSEFAAGISSALLRLGHAGTALIADGVLDLATAEVAPLSGLAELAPLCVRAREDGYWAAVQPADAAAMPELWHVGFDGAAELLGTYPEPPPNQSVMFESELDGEGRLVQFASDTTETFRDTIIRRDIEGASELIYDEADDPVVKLHISGLFTGP
jgi:hypothetical protein